MKHRETNSKKDKEERIPFLGWIASDRERERKEKIKIGNVFTFNLRRKSAQLRLLFSVTPFQNVENFYAFASDDREMQRGLRFLACHRPPVLCICMEMRVPPFSLLSGKRHSIFHPWKRRGLRRWGRIRFESAYLLAFKSLCKSQRLTFTFHPPQISILVCAQLSLCARGTACVI